VTPPGRRGRQSPVDDAVMPERPAGSRLDILLVLNDEDPPCWGDPVRQPETNLDRIKRATFASRACCAPPSPQVRLRVPRPANPLGLASDLVPSSVQTWEGVSRSGFHHACARSARRVGR
jgi:hypothetical protein